MLAVPEPFTPMVSLSEEDPLSAAPTYFPMDGGGLLSDLGAYEEGMAVGLPPRVVDGALLKSMKQVGRAACRPLHLRGRCLSPSVQPWPGQPPRLQHCGCARTGA